MFNNLLFDEFFNINTEIMYIPEGSKETATFPSATFPFATICPATLKIEYTASPKVSDTL